ncbi:MAG: hypothetical protein IKA56_05845 [Clostridia bacterium]|nr:hypothetical protein [Clostridia bacterium]
MKRIVLILTLIGIVCSMFFCLSGCSSEDKIVGIWKSSFVYNNKWYDVSVEIHNDGTYTKVWYINEFLSKAETGTYTFSSNEVRCHADDEPSNTYTVYNYTDGKLVNGSHEFVKQ